MIKINSEEILYSHFFTYKKVYYSYLDKNNIEQSAFRYILEKGHGASILLLDKLKKTAVFVEQFRLPIYLTNQDESLIETCAGLLDAYESPEDCIKRETLEECGYQLESLHYVCSPFMSPGAVTEQIHLYIGYINIDEEVSAGGGLESEHENINRVFVSFTKIWDDYLAGKIKDAKTIILIQHAKINGLLV
jgi:GDP-mannose pyrophosphatase NudK